MTEQSTKEYQRQRFIELINEKLLGNAPLEVLSKMTDYIMGNIKQLGDDLVLYYGAEMGRGYTRAELIELNRHGAGPTHLIKVSLDELAPKMPKQLLLGRANKRKNVKLTASLRAHDIKVREPRIAKPLMVTHVTVMRPDGSLIRESFEPHRFPQFGSIGQMPTYFPIYRYHGYDKESLGVLAGLSADLVVTKGSWKNMDVLYEEALDVVRTHYFGNGTIQGQIGRLAAVNAVAYGIEGARGRAKPDLYRPSTSDKSVKFWGEVLNRVFPLNPPDFEFISGLYETITLAEDMGVSLMKLNLKAAAGPIWPTGVLREDVLSQDFRMAATMLANADTVLNAEEFLADNPWMKLALIKPKAEVYERSKLHTKTRNIFVTTSGCTLLAHSIYHVMHHKPKKNALVDLNVWSMIGFSAFSGGVNRFFHNLVKKLTNEPDFIWTGVYADNYYSAFVDDAGHIIWVSLDGEKMEACVNEDDYLLYDNCLLTRYPNVQFNENWRNSLKIYHPNISAKNVGLLGDYQILIKGHGSGSIGTAYLNTFKVIRVEHQFRQIGGKRPVVKQNDAWVLSNKMIAATLSVGVKLTVESVIDLTSRLAEARAVAGDADKLDEIKVDLLGFSLTVLRKYGMVLYIPVLDRPRLMRAMCYFKKLLNDEGEVSQNDRAMYFMMIGIRSRMFYIMGGWADEAIAVYLRALVVRAMAWFKGRMKKEPELRLGMVLADLNAAVGQEIIDQIGIGTVRHVMSLRSLPTMYEVISITSGPAAAARVVKHVAENDPENWAKHLPAEPGDEWFELFDQRIGKEIATAGALSKLGRSGFVPAVSPVLADWADDPAPPSTVVDALMRLKERDPLTRKLTTPTGGDMKRMRRILNNLRRSTAVLKVQSLPKYRGRKPTKPVAVATANLARWISQKTKVNLAIVKQEMKERSVLPGRKLSYTQTVEGTLVTPDMLVEGPLQVGVFTFGTSGPEVHLAQEMTKIHRLEPVVIPLPRLKGDEALEAQPKEAMVITMPVERKRLRGKFPLPGKVVGSEPLPVRKRREKPKVVPHYLLKDNVPITITPYQYIGEFIGDAGYTTKEMRDRKILLSPPVVELFLPTRRIIGFRGTPYEVALKLFTGRPNMKPKWFEGWWKKASSYKTKSEFLQEVMEGKPLALKLSGVIPDHLATLTGESVGPSVSAERTE